jgi:HEAT repeat protein
MRHIGWVLTLLVLLAVACGGSREEYRTTIDLGPAIRALTSDDLDESSQAADRIAMAGADALPALEAALRAEPPAIRREVATVLGRIDDPRAVRLLSQAADDPEADVRYEAIVALGIRAVPDTRGAVESALGDTDPKVRLAAANACAALCASPAALARLVELGVKDPPLPNALAARSAIVRILGDADPERAERLRAAIRSIAPPVLAQQATGEAAVRAALLASDVGDPVGRDVLAAAARGGVAPALRLQAIHALGTVGDADSVPVLATIDGQPSFGEYACDALRRLAARGVGRASDAVERWRGACPAAVLPPPPGAR